MDQNKLDIQKEDKQQRLMMLLEKIERQMEDFKGQNEDNVIMLIGKTRCGKSPIYNFYVELHFISVKMNKAEQLLNFFQNKIYSKKQDKDQIQKLITLRYKIVWIIVKTLSKMKVQLCLMVNFGKLYNYLLSIITQLLILKLINCIFIMHQKQKTLKINYGRCNQLNVLSQDKILLNVIIQA